MSVRINNEAGETVAEVASDAEAVRWFHDQGRRGDYIVETGELLIVVSGQLFPEIRVEYDSSGCVVASERDVDRLTLDRIAEALDIPADPFGDLPGAMS